MAAENTARKQAVGKPFQPGQSGNPAGRPKGARSKLQEDFLKDVQQAWDERGPAAIKAMIAEKPTEFVKMVSGLMPKEMNIKVSEFDDLTDDQLARQLASIASQLARAGVAFGEGAGSAEAAQSAVGVSTLQ